MTAPVGSLGSEAAQLLDVIAQRLRQVRDRQQDAPAAAADAPADDGDPLHRHDGDADGGDGDGGDGIGGADSSGTESGGDATARGGRCPRCGHDPAAPSCTGCPWCATVALLRGERPETAARLVDGALTIVQTLRGLLAGAGADGAPAYGGEGGAPDEPAAAHPAGGGDPTLIRIDVR